MKIKKKERNIRLHPKEGKYTRKELRNIIDEVFKRRRRARAIWVSLCQDPRQDHIMMYK